MPAPGCHEAAARGARDGVDRHLVTFQRMFLFLPLQVPNDESAVRVGAASPADQVRPVRREADRQPPTGVYLKLAHDLGCLQVKQADKTSAGGVGNAPRREVNAVRREYLDAARMNVMLPVFQDGQGLDFFSF